MFTAGNYAIWQVVGSNPDAACFIRHENDIKTLLLKLINSPSSQTVYRTLKFVSLFLNQIFCFPDCPNGYIHLNNKCYRWQPPNEIDQHLKDCHNFRFEVHTIKFSLLCSLNRKNLQMTTTKKDCRLVSKNMQI